MPVTGFGWDDALLLICCFPVCLVAARPDDLVFVQAVCRNGHISNTSVIWGAIRLLQLEDALDPVAIVDDHKQGGFALIVACANVGDDSVAVVNGLHSAWLPIIKQARDRESPLIMAARESKRLTRAKGRREVLIPEVRHGADQNAFVNRPTPALDVQARLLLGIAVGAQLVGSSGAATNILPH